MGSKGRAGGGDGVNWVVHTGLFGSSHLVLVAVAALAFLVPWDGAGDASVAGAALLRGECSVNPPLRLTLPCWGANCSRLPTLDAFSRTWVQVRPFQCLGDQFAHEPSRSKTKVSWGPVPLIPAQVQSLGSAGGLDPSLKVFRAALQPVAGLDVVGAAN